MNAHLHDRARHHRLECSKRSENGLLKKNTKILTCRKEGQIDDGIERPNLENIYKYLGAVLMGENKVFIYVNGNMQMVALVKVKPY